MKHVYFWRIPIFINTFYLSICNRITVQKCIETASISDSLFIWLHIRQCPKTHSRTKINYWFFMVKLRVLLLIVHLMKVRSCPPIIQRYHLFHPLSSYKCSAFMAVEWSYIITYWWFFSNLVCSSTLWKVKIIFHTMKSFPYLTYGNSVKAIEKFM